MFQFDHQDVSWRHIVDVYEEDLGVKTQDEDFEIINKTPGLRYLHKVTEEHINITSRSRMTVKLAAQVNTFLTLLYLGGQNCPRQISFLIA